MKFCGDVVVIWCLLWEVGFFKFYSGLMFVVCRFFGFCFVLKFIFWFLVSVLKLLV